MNTKKVWFKLTHILGLCGLLSFSLSTSTSANTADLKTGNAVVEVIIPTVAPIIYSDVSPTAGDPTLVFRITTLLNNSWFDATAPYHPSAVGVYTRLGRRPADEAATNENMNIALIYASYNVLQSLLPQRSQTWRKMLTDVGLNPDNTSTNLASPVGIGNAAGRGVVVGRENDGMNQLGNYGGGFFNPMPYVDYTGYKPVNTAYKLSNPSRWQPALQKQGIGIYRIQQFVTPQYSLVEPYSYPSPRQFHVPPPTSSNFRNLAAYKQQADEVLQAAANLNEERKLKAEFFDNKFDSLGTSVIFAAQSRRLSLPEFIQLNFLTNMATFDAGIFVWQEKRRYDAVRPFSAIKYLYPDSNWKSYLPAADHPEYPSASACFCAAHTQSARRFLGTDELNWSVPRPAGSSRIEPGITPKGDTKLTFATWTDLNEDCAESRLWAGVHFRSAIDASKAICSKFGDLAYDYVQTLINGTAPERRPSAGNPDVSVMPFTESKGLKKKQ